MSVQRKSLDPEPEAPNILWDEVRPIASHVAVVLLLETSLLLIGLATRWLTIILPNQEEHLKSIMQIDAWTAMILLCEFATYTLLLVGIRLWRSLSREWAKNRKIRNLRIVDSND
jgi:hypothetical protein